MEINISRRWRCSNVSTSREMYISTNFHSHEAISYFLCVQISAICQENKNIPCRGVEILDII